MNINLRRNYLYFLCAGVLVFSMVVESAAQAPFKLDHFLGYRNTTQAKPQGIVDLNDQFGDPGVEQTKVKGPYALFNPVQKKHGERVFPIKDNDHHLTVYQIKDKKWKPRKVRVRNQFTKGSVTMTIGKPVRMLVPTQKEGHEKPQNLDHFTCYEITDGVIDPNEAVDLRDQFGAYLNMKVRKSRLLCLPSEKTHDGKEFPIYNKEDHLMWFRLEPRPFQKQIGIRNQFEQTRLKLDRVNSLLVPTKKKLLE